MGFKWGSWQGLAEDVIHRGSPEPAQQGKNVSYRNQHSALSFWICCCSGGAGASLDEMPGVQGKPQRLRHHSGLFGEHMTGKKSTELGIGVVILVMSLGSTPKLPPPFFLFYQGDIRGGMMILCVYFQCFLLVARNPSMPSL